jgi:hypothetical protein
MKNLDNTTNKQADEVKASRTIILLSPFFEHQEQTKESNGTEAKALAIIYETCHVKIAKTRTCSDLAHELAPITAPLHLSMVPPSSKPMKTEEDVDTSRNFQNCP